MLTNEEKLKLFDLILDNGNPCIISDPEGIKVKLEVLLVSHELQDVSALHGAYVVTDDQLLVTQLAKYIYEKRK